MKKHWHWLAYLFSILAGLLALILLGGIKRIGQVTEKLVTFMALLYVVFALGVVSPSQQLYIIFFEECFRIWLSFTLFSIVNNTK